MAKDADDALIRAALERSRGVEGGIRRRAAVIGVSPGTLRIWESAEEKGEPFPPLRDRVRDRLDNRRSIDDGALPYDEEREEEELKRAGEVEDPIIRILDRESIAAVIRAQAVREVAWANRLAEQNTAERLAAMRDATARGDVGEPITDAETMRVDTRRRQRGRKRAAAG